MMKLIVCDFIFRAIGGHRRANTSSARITELQQSNARIFAKSPC